MNENGRLQRGDGPWLASLLLIGCTLLALFVVVAHCHTNGRGVPLDDAWIHFQFARNLARGDGLSFNPGQPTSGSTAPLWTLLLAAVYLAGGRFPVAGQVLSALCYLTTLAATYALAKQLTNRRWAAWLAGTVVAANGRVVWAGLSALETCLFMTLSLLAIGSYLKDNSQHRYHLCTAALFGLAALSRPEGYLLFALSVASFAYDALRNTQHTTRETLLCIAYTALLAMALFTVIVSPYLIFSYRTSGHILPNTYHAKAVVSLLPDREFRDFLSVGAKYLIWDNVLLLSCFLLGLILLLKQAPLLSLWCVGLPLIYAFLRAPLYQHGRYLMPLIPCNTIVAVWGLLKLHKLACHRGWLHWRGSPTSLAIIATALIVVGTVWRLPYMASQYAHNVDDVNQMHVTLGHWVKENTPPDAVLALNDIGAITYISERPIIDLAGLVTPEVIPLLRSPDRGQQLIDLMAERNVQYVVIFPNWFPDLAARQDVLQEVHRVTLGNRTIAGGETMVVYRTRW